MTQDEWMLLHEDIEDVGATEAERKLHAASHVPDLESLEPLPWIEVEELVAVDRNIKSRSRIILRSIMMVIAALSFTLPIVRGSAALLSRQANSKDQVNLV